MTHSRPARVAQAIQEELAQILQKGLKDPRIGFVTLTGVEVGRDLRNATVFYSVMGDEKAHAETQAGLQAAAGYLRRQLGAALNMRHTPELAFKFDGSVERGARIEELLREVKGPPGSGSEGK